MAQMIKSPGSSSSEQVVGLQWRTRLLQACAPATARDFHDAGVGHAARDAAVEIFGYLVGSIASNL